VRRVDLGADAAGYERVDPGGEHHHHLVCDSCGAVRPFSDPKLERAIDQVSRGSGFRISGHDVVLRGECAGCADRA
jgi:Fur family ferric uptake transcriptional regulator